MILKHLLTKKNETIIQKRENSRIRWDRGRVKEKKKFNEESLPNFRIKGCWKV